MYAKLLKQANGWVIKVYGMHNKIVDTFKRTEWNNTPFARKNTAIRAMRKVYPNAETVPIINLGGY